MSNLQEGLILNEDDIIFGKIPQVVFDVARAQNIPGSDIWAVYLSPNDPRNPKIGEHFIGIREVSGNELSQLLEARNKSLKTNDIQQADWCWYLDQLHTDDLEKLADVGVKCIERHEMQHKKQLEHYDYQSKIISAYNLMKTELSEEGRKKVLSNYQDLVLLTEVQALSAQFLSEESEIELIKSFNIYWFSKTFELFNKTVIIKNRPMIDEALAVNGKAGVKYVTKEETYLQFLYDSLRYKGDYGSVENAAGLLSRALYVCDDPIKVLVRIRSGDMSVDELANVVREGMQSMLTMSASDLIAKAKKISEDTNPAIEQSVNDLNSEIWMKRGDIYDRYEKLFTPKPDGEGKLQPAKYRYCDYTMLVQALDTQLDLCEKYLPLLENADPLDSDIQLNSILELITNRSLYAENLFEIFKKYPQLIRPYIEQMKIDSSELKNGEVATGKIRLLTEKNPEIIEKLLEKNRQVDETLTQKMGDEDWLDVAEIDGVGVVSLQKINPSIPNLSGIRIVFRPMADVSAYDFPTIDFYITAKGLILTQDTGDHKGYLFCTRSGELSEKELVQCLLDYDYQSPELVKELSRYKDDGGKVGLMEYVTATGI